MWKKILSALCFATLLGARASAVDIDWVTVGAAGNPGDTEVMLTDGTTGYGSVPYVYRIAKYEVTNAQYAEFLNAVADDDPNGLFNEEMGESPGGITRSGVSGSYSYSAIADREDLPVNFVSFHDALRFANWLHRGQPTGAQGDSTTEDGAYTITALGITINSITRNAGATIFVTSEDEWYKAAYYDAVSASYFDYPAGTNAQTACSGPTSAGNHANCLADAYLDLTHVGSYSGSASPYGTFDQGGNVWEWNEAIVGRSGRGVRGGSYFDIAVNLAASNPVSGHPALEVHNLGFRVASLPEPGAGLAQIEVAPATLDFGMTDLGASATGMVTITNIGDADLRVTNVQLATGSDSAFGIQDPVETDFPQVLTPGGVLDVTVSFTPTSGATVAASLEVASDDPDEPVATVDLVGQGVSFDEQVMRLLDEVFDPAVTAGTLVGSGPGNSGQVRLGALRNLIEAAGDLIEAGFIGEACDQLLDAQQRTDALFPPPDFVEGPSAAMLHGEIRELRENLGCVEVATALRAADAEPSVSGPGCGLGPELVVLLLPLLALRRRGRLSADLIVG